ncbi:uncharacterized protein LOC113335894 [Papaver somniferum]|uniref:uncharacterized protein LOC113335894 n=1 Tax=Papaver somniferum TaxID=3469 RepID=UPI000E6FE2BB|nr:uncharacterized protein LOC113335894 [Papaver somniferum]
MLDQIDNLKNQNLLLYSQNDLLSSQVSNLSGLLYSVDLRNRTLSDENRTLTKERRSFLSEKATFTHQYHALRKTCTEQEESLHALESQYDRDMKRLTMENDKIIKSKTNVTVNMNKLREQHTQLKESHDILMKKNASLSQDEMKIRSCLQGLISDDFDKHREDLKNSGIAFPQYFISQYEASERTYQYTIQKLRSDLTKAHKERGKLSVKLSSSRDRANRRCLYLKRLMDV